MRSQNLGPGRVGPARLDGRDRILAILSEYGAASRADVARRSALAPSTVSALVSELMHTGLVIELDESSTPSPGPRGGRPAVLLSLHRSAGIAVGIDFGKRHIRVAVTDLAHNLLAEQDLQVTPDRPAAQDIDVAAKLVKEALKEAKAKQSHVVGVGMGIPGPVQRASGELGDSTILPGWVGVRAADAMSRTLGLPVHVDNDANLGALGEWMWGAAQGCSEVAYLKAATGIGAGLILDGRPFSGAGGTAGEIGHTIIDPSGPICRCGNRGCLETLAGTDSVLAALRPTHGARITLPKVVSLAADGDEGCRRVLADAGRAIGVALANLCNLVNPARVVVGGELGAAGDLLLVPMRESLRHNAIRSAADDVLVVESALQERAEVLGAVALALLNATPLERGSRATG